MLSLLRLENVATGKTVKYHYEHFWPNNVYPDIGSVGRYNCEAIEGRDEKKKALFA